MSDTVIRVAHLSKRYRLGVLGPRTLKEEWVTAMNRLRGRPPASGITPGPEVWALWDLSVDVTRGEVIGIVGRNGAGKSTLLKILSRITAPTRGDVRLKGRVASLLEVGTGFHPELTGRDNVFLNGMILGMTRSEIRRRFDEIVEFSGVQDFIDTPVKRYSSGMHMRLAFAVAAHLDPEILIVDEVLAVGDIAFQKKCLGKMDEVVKGGRTILFVSHNMQAVRSLCPRSLLLDKGRLVADGPTAWISGQYHELLRNAPFGATTDVHNPLSRRGSGEVRFTAIRVLDARGNDTFDVRMGEAVQFRLNYEVLKPVPELLVQVVIRSGVTSETVTSVRHEVSAGPLAAGRTGAILITLADLAIRPGEYPLYFWLGSHLTYFDVVDNVTVPLIVGCGDAARFPDVDPTAPTGYVSIPSQYAHEPQ